MVFLPLFISKSMKILPFVLIFFVALLAQFYTSLRIWQYVPLTNIGKSIATLFYNVGFVCMLLFCLLTFKEQLIGFRFSQFVYEWGTSALFVLLYLTLLFGLIDLLRLAHIVPTSFCRDSWLGTGVVSAVMLGVFFYANWNYHQKVKVELDLPTGKDSVRKPVRLLMASDLHLGYHNRRSEFAKWVDMINQEQPDAVLLAGDVVDFSVVPLLDEKTAEEFSRIKAPVFVCYGNHECIKGQKKAKAFFDATGVTLLCDSVAELPDLGIKIIGRNDFTFRRIRQPLSELVEPNDSLYTIVLDHQPFHLEEAEESGADFQFSGHTHNGQMWPVNLVIDAMYEKGYGFHQRGNTRYYVTSGLGIWGAKFRLASQSEYVVATVGRK